MIKIPCTSPMASVYAYVRAVPHTYSNMHIHSGTRLNQHIKTNILHIPILRATVQVYYFIIHVHMYIHMSDSYEISNVTEYFNDHKCVMRWCNHSVHGPETVVGFSPYPTLTLLYYISTTWTGQPNYVCSSVHTYVHGSCLLQWLAGCVVACICLA